MAYISFQPSDFFNTLLWTGNSTTDRAMTGVGFQPDFLWIKGRNEGTDHELQDSVRGSTKYLNSNDNGVEGTETEGVKSFDSDGYTLGNANYWNWTAKTFVGWSWKAGTTSGITTNGSTNITPIGYSFSATAGQSIIYYNGNQTGGDKVPHGLGVKPSLIIIKDVIDSNSWNVYHVSNGATKYMLLDSSESVNTNTNRWNDTEPDSVNFTLGASAAVNGNDNDYIAYCFAEVKGFSSIGCYTGTGQTTGPFIPCGFRPAFVIIKRIDGADNWVMFDDKRDGYNVDNNILYPNLSNVEATSDYLDLTSNGFTLRWSDSKANYSGGSYIYAAFAEFPFVSSNSKAGVAR